MDTDEPPFSFPGSHGDWRNSSYMNGIKCYANVLNSPLSDIKTGIDHLSNQLTRLQEEGLYPLYEEKVLLSETISSFKLEGITFTDEFILSSVREDIPLTMRSEAEQRQAEMIFAFIAFRASTPILDLEKFTLWSSLYADNQYPADFLTPWRTKLDRDRSHRSPTDDLFWICSLPEDLPELAPALGRYSSCLSPGQTEPVESALIHLLTLAIAPLPQGNGHLARHVTAARWLRCQGPGSWIIPISKAIEEDSHEYRRLTLAWMQDGEIGAATAWVKWFLERILRAIEHSLSIIQGIDFYIEEQRWLDHLEVRPRQRLALEIALSGDPPRVLTPKWYLETVGGSSATASRDLKELFKRGILLRGPGSGCATTYHLRTE